MKKTGFVFLSLLLLVACNDGGEKKAQSYLQAAQAALQEERFSEAKRQIDSIKLLYPKAFKARKAGIALMQQVELKEQLRSRVFLDSLLQERQKEFDSVKGRFVLEKDTAYQETGNYFYPSQTVEKNLNRTYLRAQVDELGRMSLTSIYCGNGYIHHRAVRVSAKDGSFAETPPSGDVYETSDLDKKIEKADYKLGEDGNVAGFVALNKDQAIRMELLGDRKYATTLSAADREAIAEIYALAQILSSMEEIRRQIKEADLKIEFVSRKIQERVGEE